MVLIGWKRRAHGDFNEYFSPPPPPLPASTFHLDQLPNDCLLQILRIIPMQLLLPLRIVSKKWNANILMAGLYLKSLSLRFCYAKQVRVEHESELIYSVGDGLERYMDPSPTDQVNEAADQKEDHLSLRLPPFFSTVNFVLSTFPRVESLKIEYNGNLSDIALLTLLKGVETQYPLTAFTFWYIPKNPYRNFVPEFEQDYIPLFNRICKTIGAMRALKQLHLCVDSDQFNCVLERVQPELAFMHIVHQLERLTLNMYTPQLEQVIANLGPGLTHLSLDCEYFRFYGEHGGVQPVDGSEIHRLFLEVNPLLTDTVTHLRLNMPICPEHLQVICSLFGPNLQHLTISFYRSKYAERNWFALLTEDTLNELASMEHLTELALINCLPDMRSYFNNDSIEHLILVNTGFIFYHHAETDANWDPDVLQDVIEKNENAILHRSNQFIQFETADMLVNSFCETLVEVHFTGMTKLTWAMETNHDAGGLLRDYMTEFYPDIQVQISEKFRYAFERDSRDIIVGRFPIKKTFICYLYEDENGVQRREVYPNLLITTPLNDNNNYFPIILTEPLIKDISEFFVSLTLYPVEYRW